MRNNYILKITLRNLQNIYKCVLKLFKRFLAPVSVSDTLSKAVRVFLI